MKAQVRNIDDLDEDKWNRLLQESSQSTVYHSKSWAEVWEKSYPGSNSFFIICVDENGDYSAGLPVWKKEKLGLKSFFSMPFGTYGGVIKREDKDKSCFLPVYEKLGQMFKGPRIVTAQFVDFFSSDHYLQNIGFHPGEYCTHIIHLDRMDQDDYMRTFGRKRREGIRQSQRRGVEVRDIRSSEDIKRCYQLFLETFQRHNVRSAKHPLRLFENIFALMGPGNLLKWLIALKDQRIIGSLVNFTFKDTFYAWEMGSDSKELNARPNDALFLHSIIWAKENGFKFFNFGATSEGAKGMTDFKESWGAKRKKYLIYEKKNKLGELLDKIRGI